MEGSFAQGSDPYGFRDEIDTSWLGGRLCTVGFDSGAGGVGQILLRSLQRSPIWPGSEQLWRFRVWVVTLL